MKMMLGNINLLVSGAEPECGGIWWDATMLSLVTYTSGTSYHLPVPNSKKQKRNAIVKETKNERTGQENRAGKVVIIILYNI